MPEGETRNLHLITSNRLEVLADHLGEILETPLSSVFSPESIVVQNTGMARWLSLRLADRLGISMRNRFLFPRDFIDAVLGSVLEGPLEADCLAPENLVWLIYAILPSLAGETESEVLQGYLRDGDLLKQFQLAEKLTETFDQYLVYRPDLIQKWESGKTEGDWQGILWRRLREKFPRLKHIGNILADLKAGKIDPRQLQIPERAVVFGISSLPPIYLELLRIISLHSEIHLFIPQPSDKYWGDLVSKREKARKELKAAERKGVETAPEPGDLLFEVGNPILASMGKQGKDFLNLLLDRDLFPEREPFFEPPGDTLLSLLQKDIFDLRDGSGYSEARRRIKRDDRSLQLSVCHSPMREVEALYDTLLELFNGDSKLRPRDILVMTPSIEEYAPFIHAVFGAPEEEGLFIPYAVADRLPRKEGPGLNAFFMILELAGRRATAREVLKILELPPLRERFSLSDSEMEKIRRWVVESGIRWGLDGKHRTRFKVPDLPGNTWQFGIDRMLLGYAMEGDGERAWEGILPYEEIGGDAADLLGRFLTFMELLFRTVRKLESARALSAWPPVLEEMIDSFFPERAEEYLDDLRSLRRGIGQLKFAAGLTGGEEPVNALSLRRHLERTVSTDARQDKSRPGGFLSGGVTFCELRPMRSIPAPVICLIGMGDHAFPRRPVPLSFDKIANNPRPCDRSIRDNDRYCFLETILSAREMLYLSYVGLSVRDNSEIPSSVLLSELVDYIEQSFAMEDGSRMIDHLAKRHKLHLFNAAYFTPREPSGKKDLFSFSKDNAAAARGFNAPPELPPPFLSAPLPEPEREWKTIELDQLGWFLRNPARYFLQKRIELSLFSEEEAIEESEPMKLEGLPAYHLQNRLLEGFLRGSDSETVYAAAARAGVLPLGEFGRESFRMVERKVRQFSEVAGEFIGAEAEEPVIFERKISDYHLSGRLEPVYGGNLVRLRYAAVKPGDLLLGWLGHLAASLRPAVRALNAIVMGTDCIARFEPVDDPEAPLQDLLDLYWEGLSEALPFFPLASHAYAEAKVSPGKSKLTPLQKAKDKWEGSATGFGPPGEAMDPYYRLCFAGKDPFTKRFEALALRVFEPLYDHLSKEKI